LMEWT